MYKRIGIMRVLQLSTRGMKNISNDIVISFANATIEGGIKKVNNVKGIFGYNGAGKTALIASVDLYRNLVLDPTYLLQNDTARKLDKLLNYSLGFFSFSIIYEYKMNVVLKHSIKIEKHPANRAYFISCEEISLSNGRTFDEKYKVLIHKDDDRLSITDDKKIFNGSVDYLLDAELNYASVVSKVMSKLPLSTDPANRVYSDGERVILDLYSNVRNIYAYLSNDDNHASYFQNRNPLIETPIDIASGNLDSLMCIDVYANDAVIPESLLSQYETLNSRLERFIKIFKPELQRIVLDKLEDGQVYHVRKIFKYEQYNVEFEFESSGIKQLVKLFSYLSKCADGAVVFVDEIDTNINTAYFSKLIAFFKKYGKGQLTFTSHNVEAMNALKDQSRSIVALGENNNLDVWVGKGNKSPVRDYLDGFFPNSPMNIEDFDFVNVFFGTG